MSYTSLEIAVQGVLTSLTGTFKPDDVVLSDERVLNVGQDALHGTNRAILWPGVMTYVPTSAMRTKTRLWDILIDIITRYHKDEDWAAFKTMRDEFIAGVEAMIGKNLDATDPTSQLVSQTGEADPWFLYDKGGGGPFYIIQRFRVTVSERVNT